MKCPRKSTEGGSVLQNLCLSVVQNYAEANFCHECAKNYRVNRQWIRQMKDESVVGIVWSTWSFGVPISSSSQSLKRGRMCFGWAMLFMALARRQIVSMFSFKKADVETAFWYPFGVILGILPGAAIVVSTVYDFQAASFTLALLFRLCSCYFLGNAIISLLARDTVQQVIEDQKKDAASQICACRHWNDEWSCCRSWTKEGAFRLSETVKYSDQ